MSTIPGPYYECFDCDAAERWLRGVDGCRNQLVDDGRVLRS
jgi:hypothetical protein